MEACWIQGKARVEIQTGGNLAHLSQPAELLTKHVHLPWISSADAHHSIRCWIACDCCCR